MEMINNRRKRYYKLEPVARMIAGLLEETFHEKASFELDVKKSWLTNIPQINLYESFRDDIKNIYHQLVDQRWTLDERLELINAENPNPVQKVDIWFDEPYCFFVEFDEPKHFSQFRLRTLELYNAQTKISLDLDLYKRLCRERTVEPGMSGFQRIKGYDPLFPPMLPGDEQDNKPRQRAFHDLLADLSPSVFDLNPVIRISSQVTNGRIKEFTQDDLASVRKHIIENKFLDQISLRLS